MFKYFMSGSDKGKKSCDEIEIVHESLTNNTYLCVCVSLIQKNKLHFPLTLFYNLIIMFSFIF